MSSENPELSRLTDATKQRLESSLVECLEDIRMNMSLAKNGSISLVDAIDRTLNRIPDLRAFITEGDVDEGLRDECRKIVDLFAKPRAQIEAYFLKGAAL